MKKILLTGVMIGCLLVGLISYQYHRFYDGKLHVIFCDVGQGDAVIIRTPEQNVFLIDGGPDDSVISCMGRHLPFWKREIAVMFLTHPHGDHFFGQFAILERFNVKAYATIALRNKNTEYVELRQTLEEKRIPTHTVSVGDMWQTGGVKLLTVGPSETYLKQLTPDGTINTCDACPSLALELQHNDFSMLLTGDSEDLQMAEIASMLASRIDVLQIPHHGSATGVNKAQLEEINPRFAIISVGRENRYNHPHPSILNLLSSLKISVRRTDLAGDVEVVSDGVMWWLKE